jgi:hypothetical protein
MTRPNLDTLSLKPGEREELERLFDYTDRLMEQVERDPAVGRALLERIGFFEMKQEEEEERQAQEVNGHSNNGSANGHGGSDAS